MREASIDEDSIQILSDLFDASKGGREKISRMQFRAKYPSFLDKFDDLENSGFVIAYDDNYSLPITSLLEIKVFNQAAENTLYLCGFVFPYLNRAYLQKPGGTFEIQEFANFVDLPDRDVAKAINLLDDLSVFDTISRDANGTVTYFSISESVLRIGNFKEALDSAKSQRLENYLANNSAKTIDLTSEKFSSKHPIYVHAERITELESLSSEAYDLTKVIQICEELNISFENGSYLAVASLVRILLDHIPPIFSCKNFKEMANNSSSKSVKKSLLNLENSSRNISDSVLHQQIRKNEVLPNAVTVDFSNDVDVLLSEIIRVARSCS